MYNWLDWSAPHDSISLATTVVLVLVNIGCAVSPMIINALTSDSRQALITFTICYCLLTVYVHKASVVKE